MGIFNSLLLKFSGLKSYLYGAVIALMLLSLVYVYWRGESHMKDQQAALASAATALNVAAGALAERKENQIVLQYQTDISAPPIAPSPGLVCSNTTKLQPPATHPAAELTVESESREDSVFNPSGALRTDARNADAQINALIATVKVLEDELRGTTK